MGRRLGALPEAGEGQGPDRAAGNGAHGQRLNAVVEDHATEEAIAGLSGEAAQPGEVTSLNACRGLDLHSYKLTEAIDDHGIHLELILVAIHHQIIRVVCPAGQVQQLAIDEAFENVAKSCAVSGNTRSLQTEKMAEKAGVEKLHFGRFDNPGQTIPRPGGDAPHKKYLLENHQVTADRFAVEPDPGTELGVIAELAADLGQCGEQLWQRQKLVHFCDLAHIALKDGVEVAAPHACQPASTRCSRASPTWVAA